MQALAYPNSEADDEFDGGAIKGQLLSGLRSFCSALRVCEEVCSCGNIFHDGKAFFIKVRYLIFIFEFPISQIADDSRK